MISSVANYSCWPRVQGVLRHLAYQYGTRAAMRRRPYQRDRLAMSATPSTSGVEADIGQVAQWPHQSRDLALGDLRRPTAPAAKPNTSLLTGLRHTAFDQPLNLTNATQRLQSGKSIKLGGHTAKRRPSVVLAGKVDLKKLPYPVPLDSPQGKQFFHD